MGFLDAIFGGGGSASYNQIAPETTMTEAQKAMQAKLIAMGNMGYDQAMKYADEGRFKRNSSFYDAAKQLLQTGQPPTIDNIKKIQAEEPQPVAPTTPQPTAPTALASNPFMDTLYKAHTEGGLFPQNGMNAGLSNRGEAIVGAMTQAGLDPDALITEATGLSKEQRAQMGMPNSYYFEMMPELTNKVMETYGASQKQNQQQEMINKLKAVK